MNRAGASSGKDRWDRVLRWSLGFGLVAVVLVSSAFAATVLDDPRDDFAARVRDLTLAAAAGRHQSQIDFDRLLDGRWTRLYVVNAGSSTSAMPGLRGLDGADRDEIDEGVPFDRVLLVFTDDRRVLDQVAVARRTVDFACLRPPADASGRPDPQAMSPADGIWAIRMRRQHPPYVVAMAGTRAEANECLAETPALGRS